MDWKSDSAQKLSWNEKQKSLTIPVDIGPPFITGESFDVAGADPAFCLHDGVLYLVFVDGDYIKIAIVDQSTMAVTSLLRTISAPGASRPRLIFEPATYDDCDDLPHVAYVCSDGKVYGYREQYLEDLSIETVTDEIGTGTCIEAIEIDDVFYHFYVNDGVVYIRKQGEYASAFITPDSGAITGIWVWETPDGRVGFTYTLLTTDDGGEIYTAYSNLLFPIDGGSDSFTLSAAITAVEYRTGIAVFNPNSEYTNYTTADNGMELAAMISAVQLIASLYSFTDSAELTASIEQVLLPGINEFDDDSMELAASIVQVLLPDIYEFDGDSMQLTASITAVTLEEE